jgi:hypothetical protein
MQRALKNLALSILFFTAATAFAEHSRVSVPFSFVAEARTFPAGEYVISLNSTESIITLSSEANPGKSIQMGVIPADKAHTDMVLEFNVVGRDHCLKTIQVGPRISSKLSNCEKPNNSAQSAVGN